MDSLPVPVNAFLVVGDLQRGRICGVEVSRDLVAPALESYQLISRLAKEPVAPFTNLVGNALALGSSPVADRIYVTCGLEEDDLPYFRGLLRPGGVLVVRARDPSLYRGSVAPRKMDSLLLT
jgi:hypothetical protein